MQKKNKDRVNIYMNDEYAFACDAGLVYIHNITKGRAMEKDNLEDIVNEDNYIKAKNSALHFLERSFKSAKQVVDKLTLKEFDVKTIDRVMVFLRQYDFVDDNRYVELFIKEKIRSSGKNKIKYALIKKGLPEDIISQGLNKITTDQQLQIALQLGEKKIRILAKSESNGKKLYKKTSDYLFRNGYNFEIINQVLNKVTENYDMEQIKERVLSEDDYEENYKKIHELASKRYNILIKSETENIKIYKKLGDYLLRRGFEWDGIKKVLRNLINGVEEE
jgi:regulatory protein